MKSIVTINGAQVGAGRPTYVIAEAGVNHNGDMDMAHKLVDAAAEAGVDAVKFQTFKVENLVTRAAPKANYQVANTGEPGSQFEMLTRLKLDPERHEELRRHCRERGVEFLSSPFDTDSLDFLVGFGVAAIKLPSGEINNPAMLRASARSGLPVILSTGMSTLEEVAAAHRMLAEAGCDDLVLLHCLSNYPADPAEVNLRSMDTMARAFRVPVGYSDHTLGTAVPLAAVALGAVMIEKHFTLDRDLPGPDHAASLEPRELASMMAGIRAVEAALGDGVKRPQPGEANTAAVARKSLVAARDITAGTVVTEDMLAVKRPGTGLPPTAAAVLVGRRARRNLPRDGLVTLDDMETP